MEVTRAAALSAYYARLLGDESEFQEFVTHLTVNETYFFREPSQLALLTDVLLPRLLAGRDGGEPIRIFSAGCSSGEEPYSIAMAVREKFGAGIHGQVSIVAADIDRCALARARQAEYGEFSFRALSPDLRARYFSPRGAHRSVLDAAVRDVVEFRQFNLLTPHYPSGLSGFDIVFFRNVSIYFDADTRRAVLQRLHAVMNDGASLVLGASETLANDLGVFELREASGGFYFAKSAAANGHMPLARPSPEAKPPAPTRTVPSPRRSPARPQPVAEAPAVTAPGWSATMEAVRRLLRDKQHEQALALIGSLAPEDDIRPRLLESHVRLQMRQFSEAAGLARQVLLFNNWSAEAHMLIGLACKWQGDVENAVRAFRILVYSKPDCWPAHYYLAALCRDDEASARRGFATALRQIDAHPDPDGGLELPLDLPVADIRFLCERRSAAASSMTRVASHGA
ncbi:CheR family methyltransferase [Paludibacterium yongneupense]|nr:protein-glutamate O-methyltransferase CheR [Paludibacterium yongneupense]